MKIMKIMKFDGGSYGGRDIVMGRGKALINLEKMMR